jgi:hypothetical protein
VEVRELEVGDLFVWDLHAHYLHQLTNDRDDDRRFANHIATKDDNGRWRFHDPRPSPWNPYCDVRLVTI